MSTSMTDVGPIGRDLSVHADTATPAHSPQHDEQDATALVRLALDKNVSVDVIERLVALQERVTDRNARRAYFEALTAFQEECPEIGKSKTAKVTSKRTGSSYSYSYAPLDEVARTIRPVLKKHGLSYNFTVAQASNNLVITCMVRHIDGHAESADFPVPIDLNDRMSAAQSNGAALTYGKRQALVAALGLTTADVDNDARARRNDGDEKPITDEEIAALEDLIEAADVNRAKFLKWLNVEKLSDLPRGELERARKALQERLP